MPRHKCTEHGIPLHQFLQIWCPLCMYAVCTSISNTFAQHHTTRITTLHQCIMLVGVIKSPSEVVHTNTKLTMSTTRKSFQANCVNKAPPHHSPVITILIIRNTIASSVSPAARPSSSPPPESPTSPPHSRQPSPSPRKPQSNQCPWQQGG